MAASAWHTRAQHQPIDRQKSSLMPSASHWGNQIFMSRPARWPQWRHSIQKAKKPTPAQVRRPLQTKGQAVGGLAPALQDATIILRIFQRPPAAGDAPHSHRDLSRERRGAAAADPSTDRARSRSSPAAGLRMGQAIHARKARALPRSGSGYAPEPLSLFLDLP